jgi:phage terminase large subunit
MMARNRRSNRDRQDVGGHPPIEPQTDSLTADPAPAPELGLDYRAREQFLGFHARGERFACIVTHRRAGKTVACIQALQRAALTCARERPRFAYLSPFLKQSKTVAWDYLRGAIAPLREMGARVRESELRVDYPNGGQVRLYGADNPDALRGIYLDGVVLDEYADMDARVWAEIIRPALADRAGWAVFIGTPKGRNAFFALWRRAQAEANWFSLMLKASDTGLIPADELELARRDLTEEQYAQEFECSFEAAVVGAYYGKLMARAEEERRVARAPHDPAAPVWTSWDLGMRDATAIWFAQAIGREIRIIDYYEGSGVDLGHYVRELFQKPYVYAGHIVPHDAQAKELGTGKSRLEVLEQLGLRTITLAPMHRIEDGINAVRVFIPKCWFDAQKCARGIDALKLYRAEVDATRADPSGAALLKPHPVHDWTSHAADSFRYLAMTLDAKATRSDFHRRLEYTAHGVV